MDLKGALLMVVSLWAILCDSDCGVIEAECDLDCGVNAVYITSDCECACDLWSNIDEEDSDGEDSQGWPGSLGGTIAMIVLGICFGVPLLLCVIVHLREVVLAIYMELRARAIKAEFDRIQLSIHSFRGSGDINRKDHPRNVLKDNMISWYYSGDGPNQSEEQYDWIIFKVEARSPVLPKKVIIGNSTGSYSLTSIALSASVDGSNFEDIATNHKINANLPKTVVNVSNQQKGCNFLKLTVLGSLSNGINKFHSFSVYGVLCEDEEAIPLAEP